MLIYIILGIIQGFTEPIPISSSGHLIIFKHILNAPILNDLNFEIFSNFGSFVAIIIVFRKDIIKIFKNSYYYTKTKKPKYKSEFNYLFLIIIGTIPAGLIGLFLNNFVENTGTNVKLIGISLIITAFFLFIIRNIEGDKNNNIKVKDAIIIGIFQAFALFPGISRSGATIVGGMLRKLTKETSFKYSFMLYIPITIATMILKINDITNLNQNLLSNYLIGSIFAFFTTLISIKWFKQIMIKGKLIYFVYYCLIVGILTILLL
ncbi:MAG: undecaprenyl-diphosphate phosphatase [Bacilli bacterium]|nr:undecaprenyl-diphosphate phosphatase [Bacilli bacterium]